MVGNNEASPKAGPDVRCPAELSESYSGKPAKTQREAQRGIIPAMPPLNGLPGAETLSEWKARLVRDCGFLKVEIVEATGPIACIGSPLVCLGYGNGWTSVWVCRSRWNFPGDPFRIWLTHGSQAAVSHALKLRDAIRRAAQAEHDRRERQKASVLREKFGGAQ